MVFFTFLILVLTVGRVTRLVTNDEITKRFREMFTKWLREHGRPGDVHPSTWEPRGWKKYVLTLVGCPWCVSVWCSGATVLLVLWCTDYSMPLTLFWWPALSMAAVLILDIVDGAKNVVVQLNQKK